MMPGFILEMMLPFKYKLDIRVLQKISGTSFLENCSALGSPEPCPHQKAGDQEAMPGSMPVGNPLVETAQRSDKMSKMPWSSSQVMQD